ncbi:hypothetical protein Fmac_010557 [Flemingia macrophylla]|uniref:Uncharacterized protein n=1 Tax=Flemingia macrophylla TaxID=520843 RepID=A0ABD1MJX1_9FABA
MNMNHQGDREFVLSVVKYKEGKCNEQITMVVSSLKYENLNPSTFVVILIPHNLH